MHWVLDQVLTDMNVKVDISAMQSPFIGAVDTATDPVLYKRYIDPSDILLVRSATVLVSRQCSLYRCQDIAACASELLIILSDASARLSE